VKFAKATERYEAWLGGRLRLIPRDIDLKHERMRAAPFEFLRSTFYRWAQIWRDVCGDSAKGPEALSVGDLHVENFGTWRDSEGRLVWGINDFDEACLLPFSSDLIRLATSARFADLSSEPKAAAAAILEGYAEAIEAGGRPFVLAERHKELRELATARLHHAESYWQKLRDLPHVKDVPPDARKAIERLMPEGKLEWHTVQRVAGLGSLGRERYAAITAWRGGFIAREAKALAPSACRWIDRSVPRRSLSQELLDRAVRCRDPFVRFEKRWVVRRLAPDCSRIELSDLPKQRAELRLLRAMGWETANVHLGSLKRRDLQEGLAKRPRAWLQQAAQKMERAVHADFEEWSAVARLK
jgi:hypothetical protein